MLVYPLSLRFASDSFSVILTNFDRRMFKIMPFFSKFLSCPVFVHLAQFSYINKTTFLHENARRKLMCQPPCRVLIVFSLRFVNKYGLSDQCLVYKANGFSGGGCLIDPAALIFLSLTFGRLFLRSIYCRVRHLPGAPNEKILANYLQYHFLLS